MDRVTIAGAIVSTVFLAWCYLTGGSGRRRGSEREREREREPMAGVVIEDPSLVVRGERDGEWIASEWFVEVER